jgi:hypothetical protein
MLNAASTMMAEGLGDMVALLGLFGLFPDGAGAEGVVGLPRADLIKEITRGQAQGGADGGGRVGGWQV